MEKPLSYFKSKANQRKTLLAFLWFTMAVVAVVFRAVMLPFLLAALLSYVLDPLVCKISNLKKVKLPRWCAVITIYIGISALFYLLSAFFVPEFYREMTRLARDTTIAINQIDEAKIQDFTKDLRVFFRKYNLPVEIVAPSKNGDKKELSPTAKNDSVTKSKGLISIDLVQFSRGMVDELIEYVREEAANIVTHLRNLITNLLNFVVHLFLVLIVTAFILVDTERIKRFMFSLVATEDRTDFDKFLGRINKGLSGVVRGQLVICLVNGMLTLIGLLALKMKFALTLATLATIFSLIPIFGSILSTVPIVLVGLTISPMTALLALLWIVFIHVLEANFLNPKIMGGAAKIHPILILLALMSGKYVYGLVGALLAVPIASILITIFNSILLKAKELDVKTS